MGFDEAVSRIASTIRDLLLKSDVPDESVSGIGIGCAGPVDRLSGKIVNPDTLPKWFGKNIVEPLRSEFSRSNVLLDNDANVSALGEYYFGAGKSANPLMMITIGTGVGGGLIVNGGIYRGAQGEHPEFGHIPTVVGPGRIVKTLEDVISGTALLKEGNRRNLNLNSAKDLFLLERQGNATASQIIDEAVDAFGISIRTIAHTYLPDKVVLGGGVTLSFYDRLFAVAQATLSTEHLVPRGTTQIVRSALGELAAVVGAACLTFEESG
jgi:glucokinase